MKKVLASFVVAGLLLAGCSGGDSSTVDTSKGEPAKNRKPDGQTMGGAPAGAPGAAPAAGGGGEQMETPGSVGK